MGTKLSKKTLLKSFHNWYYGNLTCFSQEHMQTFGYLSAMLPLVKESGSSGTGNSVEEDDEEDI